MQQWAAVHELFKQRMSKKQIAKQLGMSRNTVRRLLEQKEVPKYHREHYPNKLERYEEQIYEWRCKPYSFNGTRMYKELKKLGYEGSIGPLYRMLRKVDEDSGLISSKATVRIETPVGDQAQFDWAEYEMMIGGKCRTVYCFSMILAASRLKAICFSLRVDADSIYEAIQDLFSELRGVTLELLIDNPKALVIENDPKSEEEIKYNPQALMLAKHMGFELNACPCYWPRKKGKCEKPYQYIEEQLIKGNNFETMEELNQRGKAFMDEWNGETHTTTKRIPREFYETEEKHALLPLPEKRFRMGALKKRIVSNDSQVSIDTNKYSVPVKYVGKQVFYRIVYGFRIEIYDKDENLILAREASGNKHETLRDPEHYEPIAKKVGTSIPQIRRDFTAAFAHGALYLENAGRRFEQPTHHARRILELADIFDVEVLDLFIAYSVKHDAMDIKSFKKLLKENFNEVVGAGPSAMPEAIAAEAECSFRDCSYYEGIQGGGT